jgi:ABC-type branched-subunit amino acid transport system substrate-binding protein
MIGAMGEFDTGTTGGTQDPEWPGAVQARVKTINAHGGINGRPVQVLVCNTALDPNKATACARDAVAKGVVAEIGLNTSESAQVVPILEQAGIPLIGPVPVDLTTLASPVSFPIISGVPGAFFGMPALLAQQHATKVALIYPNIPGGSAAIQLYETSAQAHGLTSTGEIAVPLTATDLTPSVAAATKNGTDGLVAFLVGQAQGTLLATIRQQGFQGPVVTAASFLTPQLLESAGASLDGTLIVGSTRPPTSSSPGVDMFLADMAAYDPSLPTTDGAENNWAATWLFERVAETLDDVTAANVLAAMGKLTNMDMGGIVPPLTTTSSFQGLPGITRLFNPTVTYQVIKNGKLVLIDDAADPFTNPFAP